METAYHRDHITPDDNPSYTTITSTSSSNVKLQWLALLLPAAAALCLYICLQVRHTRRSTKKQHYNGISNSSNMNNGSSSPSSSDISTMTINDWTIPSYYHYHHDHTRTHSPYSTDYHHSYQQRELPLVLFSGQQNDTTGIHRPPSVHHGPWRRYRLHHQDCATLIHGRRQSRHPHRQRRRRRRRPRTPPPAYQGIGFSPPPPSYEDIMQQSPLPPLLQQRLSNDNEPLAHIHSTLDSSHSPNSLIAVSTPSVQNNSHINY